MLERKTATRVGYASFRVIGVFCQKSCSYRFSHSNRTVTFVPFVIVAGSAFVGRKPHSSCVSCGIAWASFTPEPFSSHAANWYLPPSGVDL
ncbi:MAG: hypothetical protein BWY59_00516 [Verrucomicrobia bacterium ADurb.Bin345]|nr:MAG: hypothetical protein BWY59_00516 [Verrucomicrobia bacterium ADurb.Bin345]